MNTVTLPDKPTDTGKSMRPRRKLIPLVFALTLLSCLVAGWVAYTYLGQSSDTQTAPDAAAPQPVPPHPEGAFSNSLIHISSLSLAGADNEEKGSSHEGDEKAREQATTGVASPAAPVAAPANTTTRQTQTTTQQHTSATNTPSTAAPSETTEVDTRDDASSEPGEGEPSSQDGATGEPVSPDTGTADPSTTTSTDNNQEQPATTDASTEEAPPSDAPSPNPSPNPSEDQPQPNEYDDYGGYVIIRH